MEISAFQQYVRDYCRSKGWDAEPLETRVLYLMSEVGEVAKSLMEAHRHSATPAERESARQQLGLELFDVIWNLTDVANRMGLDLTECFDRKMDINKSRTWLAEEASS